MPQRHFDFLVCRVFVLKILIFDKTSKILKRCYEELELNNVDLAGTILKPNITKKQKSTRTYLHSPEKHYPQQPN